MFSIMTTASSTTKPVEIVSAISERLFRLKPRPYITANVPTIETGTVMPGMKVAAAEDGRVVAVGDDERLVLAALVDLIVRRDRERLRRTVEAALRLVHVRRA